MENRCSTSDYIVVGCFLFFCGILVIISLCMITVFIQDRYGLLRTVFIITLLFVIISMLSIGLQGIILGNYCLFGLNDDIIAGLDQTYLVFYAFQLELLCIILLQRAYILFKDTVVNISKYTLGIFGLMFVFNLAYFIWSSFFFSMYIYVFSFGSLDIKLINYILVHIYIIYSMFVIYNII